MVWSKPEPSQWWCCPTHSKNGMALYRLFGESVCWVVFGVIKTNHNGFLLFLLKYRCTVASTWYRYTYANTRHRYTVADIFKSVLLQILSILALPSVYISQWYTIGIKTPGICVQVYCRQHPTSVINVLSPAPDIGTCIVSPTSNIWYRYSVANIQHLVWMYRLQYI